MTFLNKCSDTWSLEFLLYIEKNKKNKYFLDDLLF